MAKQRHDKELRSKLLCGDSRKLLAAIPPNSIDACITDPPYVLDSVRKRFGNTASTDQNKTGERIRKRADPMARTAAGFMGLKWDTGETAHDATFWEQVYRVLKPGAYLLAFSSTRTYHRLACAIEDAGFEVRDMVGWIYGSGMPKSHDIGKLMDKAAGKKRTRKIGVKPGHEDFAKRTAGSKYANFGDGALKGFKRPWQSDNEARERYAHKYEPVTADAKRWDGWGTALKPGLEPVCMARSRRLSRGSRGVFATG